MSARESMTRHDSSREPTTGDSPRPTDRSDDLWKQRVGLVLLLALCLRLFAAYAIDRHVTGAERPFLIEGDAAGYWELGKQVATGNDYAIHAPPRYVLRTPGFPVFLALSIRLFGDSIFAARILLAIVGAGCCWLTWCLGRQLHSAQCGFWAALLVTVSPLQIVNSVLILSETWFTFWMLLSLLALCRLTQHSSEDSGTPSEVQKVRQQPRVGRHLGNATACGALIGLATLVRPGFLPWVGIAAIAVTFPVSDRKRKAIVCTALCAGCLLTLLPWAARNHTVTQHWVFTSLWSGPSLYDGLNPQATGASDMRFFDEERAMDRMSEFEMNEHYRNRAIRFATDNPERVMALAWMKARRFLSPVPMSIAAGNWAVGAICVLYYSVFLALATKGIVHLIRDPRSLLLTTGPFVLFLLVHMVFVGSLRYRLPVEFPVAVSAAIGIWSLAKPAKKPA